MARVNISYVWEENRLGSLSQTLKGRTIFSGGELTLISEKLEGLSKTIKSQDAKNELIDLYGRIESYTVNNLIDRIVDESFLLFEKRSELSPEILSEKIKGLQTEIAQIWYDHALSISNKRFIGIAVRILSILQVFPFSKTADMLNLASVSNLMKEQEMLPDSEVRTTLVDPEVWESAEIALDLCEMAHFFYQNKISEGMKKLHLLNPSEKSRLEEFCLILEAEFPQHFKEKNVTLYRENMIRFIQALIWRANEVAQGQPISFYPSPSEIHMMFSEVEALTSEENELPLS